MVDIEVQEASLWLLLISIALTATLLVLVLLLRSEVRKLSRHAIQAYDAALTGARLPQDRDGGEPELVARAEEADPAWPASGTVAVIRNIGDGVARDIRVTVRIIQSGTPDVEDLTFVLWEISRKWNDSDISIPAGKAEILSRQSAILDCAAVHAEYYASSGKCYIVENINETH